MPKFVCFVGLLLLISCCKEHEAVKPVVIGGAQGGAGIPEGAVNGLFSVSEGRVVCFSRGNLQYQASTGTWRFAEQQHQYIGYSNSDIAVDYNGWIDLLGWGTSGWDGAGASRQPWSSSDDYSTYGPVGEFNLTGDYSNADWGVYCAIANGGGKAGLWRTLSREEWDYLFFSRAEAAGKWGYATVAGTHGIIVLPDRFTDPKSGADGAAFVNGSVARGWQANSYEGNGWASMEAAGALFLPAAGDRNGTNVADYDNCGDYWSSTCRGESGACILYFSGNDLYTYSCGRGCGFSVRLVCDIH
ncbi:MAG: hypothetical protein IJU81_06440 [Bacteroidales bacterium]|nr:hypothetical protein [Bacteroidales bacterium]